MGVERVGRVFSYYHAGHYLKRQSDATGSACHCFYVHDVSFAYLFHSWWMTLTAAAPREPWPRWNFLDNHDRLDIFLNYEGGSSICLVSESHSPTNRRKGIRLGRRKNASHLFPYLRGVSELVIPLAVTVSADCR